MTIRKLLNYWFGRKRDSFYLFWAFVFAALYLSGIGVNAYGSPSLARILKAAGFAGFVLIILLLFVHINLYASHEFLKLFQKQGHFPKKQIQHVNSFCMKVFLGVAAVFMFGLPLLLEPLWPAIASWFSNLRQPDSPPLPPQAPEVEAAPRPDFAALFGETPPPPAWMKIADQALNLLGAALAIAVCLFLLRAACLYVWNWLKKPRHFDDDEKIYLRPTLLMPAQKKTRSREQGLPYQLSYSGKIRRHYRRKILSQGRRFSKTSLPPAWASPQELEEASDIEDSTLHQIYEKARYSRQGGDETDWKRLSGRP